MADKLNTEQIQMIAQLRKSIPNPYESGVWYPGTMAGKPVDIRYTSSRGVPYLKIRRIITVILKSSTGEILDSVGKKQFEYYTVNLREYTMSYQGW